VEIAIRVARTWQVLQDQPQRKTVISFDNSYHGGSWIAAQASGILQGGLASHEQSAGGFAFLPGPRDEGASLEALAHYFDQHGGSVAAFIAEPILGSAGILVPTQSYWRTVRSMCSDYGVLLIADEVATGGGRCGAMLASSALGMRPDLITLSKGINSGYFPVAATLFSAKVAAPFQRGDYVMQLGSTQDGNPVGCAAASATLNFIREQGLMAEAARKGERITAHLRQAGHAAIAEVRGVGLMIGIELQHTFGTAGAYSPAETVEVRNQLKQAGLLVYHFDGGISLFPSLLMSDDTVDDMLDILDSVFATLG
jgi:adenosylmethionine-8-amino-7-oxononanoate aminotransferase